MEYEKDGHIIEVGRKWKVVEEVWGRDRERFEKGRGWRNFANIGE